MNIYPNPTENKVTVVRTSAEEDANLKLFNAYGQLVRTASIKASEKAVDIPMADLASGTYMLHMSSSKGAVLYTGKVTKL